MTRLGILADIHGNLPALQAVRADLTAFAVDHVVVAGDSINWGPFSRQVMAAITEANWAVIRGNNEFYLLDYDTPRSPAHWESYGLPPLLLEQLDPRWTRQIAALPDALSLRFRDAPPVQVVHGLPGNPWQAIFPQTADDEVRRYLTGVAEDTVICAHSHLPLVRQVDGWQVINPGSVGVPLDGQFTASYMVLEGDSVGWHVIAHRRIPFDYEALFAEFARQDYEARFGVEARLVLEEFRTARLRLHPFIEWLKLHHPDQPYSHALVDAFLQADIEAYMPEPYRQQ
jgi:predicted phosphodiesterase